MFFGKGKVTKKYEYKYLKLVVDADIPVLDIITIVSLRKQSSFYINKLFLLWVVAINACF